jgi:hypothetical protein
MRHNQNHHYGRCSTTAGFANENSVSCHNTVLVAAHVWMLLRRWVLGWATTAAIPGSITQAYCWGISNLVHRMHVVLWVPAGLPKQCIDPVGSRVWDPTLQLVLLTWFSMLFNHLWTRS